MAYDVGWKIILLRVSLEVAFVSQVANVSLVIGFLL